MVFPDTFIVVAEGTCLPLSIRVPQKECGKRSSITFFVFGTLSVTFSDTFVTFFRHFFATPFAGLLLRQGELID